MITNLEYFTNPTTGEVKPHTLEDEEAAAELLKRNEAMLQEYYASTGNEPQIDPDTGTGISGKKGGQGGGGFRLHGEPGADDSSHKHARGVDNSDQSNALDDWLSLYDREDGMRNEVLERHELYREHPSVTETWCHITTRAPASGRRTFHP